MMTKRYTDDTLQKVARRQAALAKRDKLVGVLLALGMAFNIALVETVARKGLEQPVNRMIAQLEQIADQADA